MDISSFLIRSSDPSYVTTVASIGFNGVGEYPLLFFSSVLDIISKKTNLEVVRIDWINQSDADVAVSVKMLFLGMRMVYWFGNMDELDAARKKKWLVFCKEYAGPHVLLFYTSGTDSSGKNERYQQVETAENVSQTVCLQLFNHYFPDHGPRNQSLVTAIYSQVEGLSLDSAYLLMHYARVIGKNQREFVLQWLPQLVVQEKSLFILSQYFFAHEKHKFFSLWSTLSSDYPPAFWIVFWSEQLFRAGNYVRLMQQRNGTDAKRIAFRLPFSFMQRDWRLHTVAQLHDTHAALYRLDCNLKNGGSEYALDLFYSQFFQKSGGK